jgi:hypothetical protein
MQDEWTPSKIARGGPPSGKLKKLAHTFAFPRRFARVFARALSLSRRGRREGRALVAPAALRANERSTQASPHYAETIRPSLRNGFNG